MSIILYFFTLSLHRNQKKNKHYEKKFNGSLSFTPNESADLCLLLTRIYLGKYDLPISEWKFIREIISTYFNNNK